MRIFKTLVAGLVLQMSLMLVHGRGSETNVFSGIHTAIPDGTIIGIQDVRTITSEIVELRTVRVRLKVSGNFNGDLYGYVRHNSPQGTHISILLNRPGRTSTNPHGYSDHGLDVTFTDAAANDIHNYQSVSIPSAGTPLTGLWQPDARFVDPTGVTADSTRSQFLNVFQGLRAGGDWTLFLADIDSGGTNLLESWGLEFEGKVLPAITWTTPSAIIYGTALGSEQLNATADVPGIFSYSPPAGALLNAGRGQTLTVTFVPSDTNQYATATSSVALDVSPEPLTITAGSTAKTYGQTITFAGTEFIASGLTNGDTISSVNLISAGTLATAPRGTYGIVPNAVSGSLNEANYNINFVAGLLSVGPALLTARVANQTRLYGQNNPVLTVAYSGFVNGENSSIVNGPGPTTLANSFSPIGSYPITLSGQNATNYAITYQDGTLSIDPAPLVIAADNISRAYGHPNPALTRTISGLANGEDTNVLAGTLVLTTTADEGSLVGSYSIVPSGLTSTNYEIQFVNGTLTVTPFALVVTPDNSRRTYGDPNPSFTGTAVNLQNGDNIAVTYSTLASGSSPVGIYDIVPSLDDPDGKLANYSVTLNHGSLTVEAAPLICRAADQSRLYGRANPVFSLVSTGFVNGENSSIVSGPAPTTLADAHSPAGSYLITLSGQSAPNYSITHVNGTLTVEPALLVVMAADARRAQGQDNPTFAATINGLVSGDDTNVLNGTLALNTTADQDSLSGTYPIVPSGLTSTNYTIEFINGVLTVTPYALVVSADNLSRNYGAPNPNFTGSIVGLQDEDNITVTYTTAATPSSPVGIYDIVPSLDDPDGKLTNYSVTLNHGLLTVEPAPLVAWVQNQTRQYGQANPLFPIIYEGFTNGEDATVVSGPAAGSTTAQTNSPVGIYPINVTDQSAPNYLINPVNGTLTVEPAPLVVAADNARRARGQVNPAFTATISGLVNNEDTNVLDGSLVLSTTADEASLAGTYPIVPSGLSSTNYTILFTNGVLTVTPFALVVSADNASRTYGAFEPLFTGSIAGLQDNDNITVSYATSATASSPVGLYVIVPHLNDPDGNLTNYTVTLHNGLLTIGPAPLLVKADDASRFYQHTNPVFTATVSGLMNTEGIGVLSGTLVLSTPADIESVPGTYMIVPSGLTANNYSIQFSNGVLTITKAASLAVVVSSVNPALPHSSVLFTASLTALPPGAVKPSGAVQFKVDGTNYGTPVTSVEGSASLTTSTLPWGAYNITAEYQGDGNFLGSTNMLPVPQIINTPPVAGTDAFGRAPSRGTKMPVADLVANDSDPDLENVIFDSVSASSAAGGVVKLANNWILYTPPAGFTNVDSFTYRIRDQFGGVGLGTVNLTPVANGAPPRLTLAKSVNPVRRLTVSGPSRATYLFQYADSLLPQTWLTFGMAMADASGNLELTDPTLPVPKSRFYRAFYQQDLDALLPFAFVLTSSANPAEPGSLITLTASLTALAPGSGTPSGTVQFRIDGADFGAAVSLIDGVASINTASLPVGVHNISAEYSGDGSFLSSTNTLVPPQVIDTPPVAPLIELLRSSTTGTKLELSGLTALCSDLEIGQVVTFDSFSLRSTEGGTLGLTNGWIYYTPPSAPLSADSFSYIIHDSLGLHSTGTVSITTTVGNEVTPNLTTLDLGGGNFRILFSGVPWRNYTIQYAPSLPSSDWQFLGSRTADSHGQFEYDDSLPEGTVSRYYRAVDAGNALTASPFRLAVWTNFIAHTNGRTMEMWSTRTYPDGWPSVPPIFAWNTNCLLYGLEGFTAISQCSEFEGAPGQIPVTLVTRRHGFLRGHGLGPAGLQTNGLAGKKVWFCTASNTLVQMTIAAHFLRLGSISGESPAAFYDYSLIIFTQDVPDSITPISIISPENFEVYYYKTPEIPFLTMGTEQEGHYASAGDPIPPFIFPLSKGGDSGSPNVIPSPDNKLILFSGRGISGLSPQVQADIDTLSLYAGLNPSNYHLRSYDLTAWAP